MANPFDDDDGRFKVLLNGRGQRSLWPAFADVPKGWEVELDDSARSECIAYIDRTWVEMRPSRSRVNE
ncbi:MbtH family protein [Nocardiopsis alborubida]|uniref:MbtH family protein n=1 Tax=Nocardiopsis alborubida TaxID=146802 RepID=A0A7X6MIV4_9ACTN|nr:MbtH family protein [Nocardiopsis alborubida]NKZ01375.1 MbtH family protein [Nocardiopsis alborubida]